MIAPRYLDVRYSEQERPLTDYPGQLCAYLSETYLSHHQRGQLMDLGCGRGEFLRGFADLGFSSFGVDRERVQASDHPEIRICDIESEPLPVGDDSLDVIFNKSVLEHMRDITPLLSECQRVLRPGGTMISLVPCFNAQWSHFFDDWTHVRPFTLTGLSQCLQSHGFGIVEARRFRQLPLLWKRPYLRPLSDAASVLPDALKHFKWVRFSKEWMLLAVAQKPTAHTQTSADAQATASAK